MLAGETQDALSSRLAELAGWNAARRDDSGVAEVIAKTRQVDRVHTLGEAAFFDELFFCRRELEVFTLLEALEPEDGRRRSHPFMASVLVTLMRVIGGL